MYTHEEPSDLNALEKALQKAKYSEIPFILNLNSLSTFPSYLIKTFIEIHTYNSNNFYILVAENSPLLNIFQKESLIGILSIFNRMKDLEKILNYQTTPCYVHYFPGKLFEIPIEYQEEFNKAAERNIKGQEASLSWSCREKFQEAGFPLPSKVSVLKENEDWLIFEYHNKKITLQESKQALFILRVDIYGRQLEICERIFTISLYGTLKGKDLALQFKNYIKNEKSPIIFLDLTHCHSWDEHYAKAYKQSKEFKKIYLISSKTTASNALFKLKGDILYYDYEKAYEKAIDILKKQWKITPDYAEDEVPQQPIIEISGYLSDNSEQISQFRKKFREIIKKTLKEFTRICIDIRELYRMETEARKLFVQDVIKRTEKVKIKKFNIIFIANLPRPDYIVHDLVADLYDNEFFIVSSIEEARSMHTIYPHPRFTIENSLHSSLMTVEGNIIHDEEIKIFQKETECMIQHALSNIFESSHVQKSPQELVFFDFRSIPCVYIPVIRAILDADSNNKRLIKILIVNPHLEELIKKIISRYDNVICYHNKEEAFENQICNVLVSTPRNSSQEARTYFKEIFKDIYQTPEGKNKQFWIRFHYDITRLTSLLNTEQYKLILLYGYPTTSQPLMQILEEYKKPVIELKPTNSDWTELNNNQLEKDCHSGMIKQKIIDALWKETTMPQEKRYLFYGTKWDYAVDNIFLQCINEQEYQVLNQYMTIVDEGQYEVIITYNNRYKEDKTIRQSYQERAIEKLQFHPYKQWVRNYNIYYQTNMVQLSQKTANDTDIANAILLLQAHSKYSQNIWETIPSKIKRSLKERWNTCIASPNRSVGVIFKSIYNEIQYIQLNIHTEIDEIFHANLWPALNYLKDELHYDLRYQGLELAIIAFLELIYSYANKKSFNKNITWLRSSIEMQETEDLTVNIYMDKISDTIEYTEELKKAIDTYQEKYQITFEASKDQEIEGITYTFKLLKPKAKTA